MLNAIIRIARFLVEKTQWMLLVAAILGVFASATAGSSLSGYQLHDVVMEADGGSLTISADQITLSGQLIPVMIDNENIVIHEISQMDAINLRIRKVDAWGVLEIRGARASGEGIIQKVNVDELENVGIGFFLKSLVKENRSLSMKNVIIKNIYLPTKYISNRSITIYGLETFTG